MLRCAETVNAFARYPQSLRQLLPCADEVGVNLVYEPHLVWVVEEAVVSLFYHACAIKLKRTKWSYN